MKKNKKWLISTLGGVLATSSILGVATVAVSCSNGGTTNGNNNSDGQQKPSNPPVADSQPALKPNLNFASSTNDNQISISTGTDKENLSFNKSAKIETGANNRLTLIVDQSTKFFQINLQKIQASQLFVNINNQSAISWQAEPPLVVQDSVISNTQAIEGPTTFKLSATLPNLEPIDMELYVEYANDQNNQPPNENNPSNPDNKPQDVTIKINNEYSTTLGGSLIITATLSNGNSGDYLYTWYRKPSGSGTDWVICSSENSQPTLKIQTVNDIWNNSLIKVVATSRNNPEIKITSNESKIIFTQTDNPDKPTNPIDINVSISGPTGQVAEGSNLTISSTISPSSAIASGSEIVYQWYKDGQEIPITQISTAKSPNLTIPKISYDNWNGSKISLIVFINNQQWTSNEYTINVKQNIQIKTSIPESADVTAGQQLNIKASVSGVNNLKPSYKWIDSQGHEIVNQSNDPTTLIVNNIDKTWDGKQIMLETIVNDQPTYSNYCQVNVIPPNIQLTINNNHPVFEGDQINLTVNVSGVNASATSNQYQKYAWSLADGNPIPGATNTNTNNLIINNVNTNLNGKQIKVNFSYYGFEFSSNICTLTVNTKPTVKPVVINVSISPTTLNLTEGDSLKINSNVSGDGYNQAQLKYQWYANNNPITGQTSATLTINNVGLDWNNKTIKLIVTYNNQTYSSTNTCVVNVKPKEVTPSPSPDTSGLQKIQAIQTQCDQAVDQEIYPMITVPDMSKISPSDITQNGILDIPANKTKKIKIKYPLLFRNDNMNYGYNNDINGVVNDTKNVLVPIYAKALDELNQLKNDTNFMKSLDNTAKQLLDNLIDEYTTKKAILDINGNVIFLDENFEEVVNPSTNISEIKLINILKKALVYDPKDPTNSMTLPKDPTDPNQMQELVNNMASALYFMASGMTGLNNKAVFYSNYSYLWIFTQVIQELTPFASLLIDQIINFGHHYGTVNGNLYDNFTAFNKFNYIDEANANIGSYFLDDAIRATYPNLIDQNSNISPTQQLQNKYPMWDAFVKLMFNNYKGNEKGNPFGPVQPPTLNVINTLTVWFINMMATMSIESLDFTNAYPMTTRISEMISSNESILIKVADIAPEFGQVPGHGITYTKHYSDIDYGDATGLHSFDEYFISFSLDDEQWDMLNKSNSLNDSKYNSYKQLYQLLQHMKQINQKKTQLSALLQIDQQAIDYALFVNNVIKTNQNVTLFSDWLKRTK